MASESGAVRLSTLSVTDDYRVKIEFKPEYQGKTFTVDEMWVSYADFLHTPRLTRCVRTSWDFPDYTEGVQYETWIESDGDPGVVYFEINCNSLPVTQPILPNQRVTFTMPAGARYMGVYPTAANGITCGTSFSFVWKYRKLS